VIGAGDIDRLLSANGVSAWGVASNEPPMALAPALPRAISLMVRYTSAEMAGVEDGPNPTYYAGYQRLNATLNAATGVLVRFLREAGHRAEAVEATLEDYDAVQDWGDAGVFAHKTAATRAGLGWIGKTALFVSPTLGPKGRLATVFTDLDLASDDPIDAGRCGSCRMCVDACPVGAGRDVTWEAGMERDLLFDEKACEGYLDNFPHLGGVCGICVAVCPFGKRALFHLDASG
jgi:epoxyqueuosine reductase